MGNGKFEIEEVDNYKKYIDQLENEYLETFKKIEIYIKGSPKLSDDKKNSCLVQIIDTFLSGQLEGKSVKSITGKDLRKYCDNMIYGESIYLHKATTVFNAFIKGLYWVTFFHFSFAITDAIELKDRNLMFRPMNFGVDEIFLIIFNIYFVPKIIFMVTSKYFENPARCKRIKVYTNLVLWCLLGVFYSLIKDSFSQYGILISFSKLILFLVYLLIIAIAVAGIKEIFTDEDRKYESERKRFWALKKEYEKHKMKHEKRNKDPLEWKEFLEKKDKNNYLFIIVFSIYLIICGALTIILGWVISTSAQLDVMGILLLLLFVFLTIVMLSVVKEGFDRKKHLEVLIEER